MLIYVSIVYGCCHLTKAELSSHYRDRVVHSTYPDPSHPSLCLHLLQFPEELKPFHLPQAWNLSTLLLIPARAGGSRPGRENRLLFSSQWQRAGSGAV